MTEGMQGFGEFTQAIQALEQAAGGGGSLRGSTARGIPIGSLDRGDEVRRASLSDAELADLMASGYRGGEDYIYAPGSPNNPEYGPDWYWG